jgi:hypothetical protein
LRALLRDLCAVCCAIAQVRPQFLHHRERRLHLYVAFNVSYFYLGLHAFLQKIGAVLSLCRWSEGEPLYALRFIEPLAIC